MALTAAADRRSVNVFPALPGTPFSYPGNLAKHPVMAKMDAIIANTYQRWLLLDMKLACIDKLDNRLDNLFGVHNKRMGSFNH